MSAFDAVLIANRGEIAVRIARTLRTMGLRSVLACHPIDRDSPAARAVDEVAWLAGDEPIAAHLDGGDLIRLARDHGAAAIHPGYGFVSENAAFAEAVAAAGLVFIGPPSQAIRLMGDKVASRAFAAEHGVRVARAVVEDDDPEGFEANAAELSLPVLVKASAGGGGKGMQIVRSPEELAPAIERARSEGQRFFGDGRLYVEPYVERPRHIEVQVLADTHGQCIHLLDRECSVQRRFQKIVEEAPASGVPAASRAAMQSEAVAIARAVGYVGAGTVEFIVDERGEHSFLEMNTRLQVEHPVTECITGIDLVEQQVRIAQGERLALAQDDVVARGHAIEVRVCSESPANGFAPATGRVRRLELAEGPGLRVDSGVAAGSRVSASFDPLLAKWIAHGVDRDEAVERLLAALRGSALLGVETNLDYLARVVDHPAFREGRLHTGFVAEHEADLLAEPDEETRRLAVAAGALAHRPFTDALRSVPELHRRLGGWRN